MAIVPGEAGASAGNASPASGAYTSTCAPAAASSSAFHIAAALAPATTARHPSSLKNNGRRASGAMRAGGASGGVSERFIGCSVDIGLVAAGLLEVGDEGDRLVGGARAESCDHVDERALHVLRHVFGVAADVDVRAFGDPSPQVAPDFAHAMLDVDFLPAVARPRQSEASENAGRLHAGQLILIKEVVAAVLVAEEQPVAAGRLDGHA